MMDCCGIDIYQFMAKDKRALRQLAACFVICGESLYRLTTEGMLLLCLDWDLAD